MGWFSEDPKKKASLVKTDFWGNKTYHDPKTGKKLDRKHVKDEKLKKAGWW